jgi:hypothetical protein
MMYVFLGIPDLLLIIHASSSYSPSTTVEIMCALNEKKRRRNVKKPIKII